MDHVGLADAPAVLHRDSCLPDSQVVRQVPFHGGLGNEGERSFLRRAAEGPEHRAIQHRLRRGNGSVGVSHHAPGDESTFDHDLRLHPEECRLPLAFRSANLPGSMDPHMRGNTVRYGRIFNCVLGHEALHPEIVVAARILRQWSALHLHFMRGLPGAQDHFADPAHGLRVAREHAEHAQVVQDILRRNRLRADAALGECYILRRLRDSNDGRPSACPGARRWCSR